MCGRINYLPVDCLTEDMTLPLISEMADDDVRLSLTPAVNRDAIGGERCVLVSRGAFIEQTM